MIEYNTNKEILEKAIQKAIDGGWKGLWDISGFYIKDYHMWDTFDDKTMSFHNGEFEDYEMMPVAAIIFNHDFAKALWGDELVQYPEEDPHTVTARMGRTYERTDELWVWQYHLQQAVVSKDPLQYFLDYLKT